MAVITGITLAIEALFDYVFSGTGVMYICQFILHPRSSQSNIGYHGRL
jgi:hypothetical protein